VQFNHQVFRRVKGSFQNGNRQSKNLG
jgi:hypothetical protein